MTKEYVIGIDAGTSCMKALALDIDGNTLFRSSYDYNVCCAGSKVEQDSNDWIAALRSLLGEIARNLSDRKACGISISTQGGTTVGFDAYNAPIGNAITWMDSRATEEASQIEEELSGEYVYHASGWRINPALDPSKLRYMRRRGAYGNAVHFYTTLEVLNGYLTDNYVIDPTNAAQRQLYNLRAGDWDNVLINAALIRREQLPTILPTGAYIGGLSARAATQTGLAEGTPVYNGVHDQYSASIGAGIVKPGEMLLSAGTTWVLLGITQKPLFTPSYIAPGRHPIEGMYGAIASLVGSGSSLKWFSQEFMQDGFDKMNQIVPSRREKTRELFFYPYLSGAFFPHWKPEARGAFTGLTLDHDRFDLARAIMESCAFNVRRAIDDFRQNGQNVQALSIMGGASKSGVWCQMIADAAGVDVFKLATPDVCALGAAAIALWGCGKYPNLLEASARLTHIEQTFSPEKTSSAYYDEKRCRYDDMWNCISKYYDGRRTAE